MRKTSSALLPACLALVLCSHAHAEPGRFDLGLRGNLFAADGEPANDIPGAGLFAHWQLSDRWRLAFGFDQAEYDFEQPARLLGLVQSESVEPVDVLAESQTVSLALERTYGSSGRTVWFWGVGLGFASIDVPDARGPLASGGRFDIRTEADTEIVAQLSAGVVRRLGSRFALEFGVRADQHFADWQLTDRASGRRGAVDDYLALGGYLGVSFRF